MFDNLLKSEEDSGYTTEATEHNLNSERMDAGYNALFEQDGEAALDTFWNVRGEHTEFGSSPTSEGLKTALHQEETDTLNLGLQGAILDPNVHMETKQGLVSMPINDDRPESSLPEKLGRELLMKPDEPVGIPATDMQEEMRGRFINSLSSLVEYRSMQQAVMDDYNSTNSPTVVSTLTDLATLVLPFVEQSNVAEALTKVGSGESTLGSFLMMGNNKEEFINTFKRMPIEERKRSAQKFVDVARQANTTAFVTNGILEKQMVEELIYGGGYTDVDKWVDNLIGWIDLTVIGKPAAWIIRGGKGIAKAGKTIKGAKALRETLQTKRAAMDLMSQMKMDITRTGVSPVSPIRMASETNSQSAKAMFNAVVQDTTEEAAGALGGASRADVIADAVLPEFHRMSGVRAKVENIEADVDRILTMHPKIRTALDESSVNALTRAEINSATANEVNALQDVVGVTSRTKMFQHEVTPTGAKIHAVYGPTTTGWANGEDAMEHTLVALRAHGVERSDLYLMERSKTTGEYARVDGVVDAQSDFLVGLDFDYKLNYSNVSEWGELSVSKNFLDRIPLLAKHSINRNFFDPANILNPHLFLGANAKVDRSAQVTKDFQEIGKKFSDGFGRSSKDSQASMYNYILEANEKQMPRDVNMLRGEYGFSNAEIKVLDDFREYWDTVWATRNVTDIKALRNKGYGVFQNAEGDNIFSRMIGKAQYNRKEKVYNPATGMSEFISEEKLTKLYEEGHSVGKLRRPQQLGGTITDQMILMKDAGWRALKDSDKVYPYRHGYFQRMYKSPHFIVKEGTTSGGVKFERAIATADNEVDANVYLKGLRSGDSEGMYHIRTDVKDPRAQGEYELDTFESMGMTMQRERGEKLVDASAAIHHTEDANVMGPVDAIIASSRSLGNKIGMGDFIEASKQRFMKQFKDQLQVERGMVQYPTRMENIGAKGMSHSKEAADARATYEYISFLEYGYINGMDSVYKSVFKSLASLAAGKGLARTEKGLAKISEVAPTALMKQAAFQMYIATNPIRQAALNAHQATLLTAKFPKYVASQRLAADMHAFMYLRMNVKMPKAAIKLTGRTEDELKLMWKEYQKSGLSASIDQNNLMRGSLTDMVEAQKFKGEQGLVSGGLGLAQRVGFNLGEEINVNSAWLAHYDEASKAKRFLDASDFDRIVGNARNYTFNMNRAGDMPYNHNAFSVFFQFMQVPHKSLLQMGNRALSGADKTKLGMYNLVMFTLPPAAMYDWFGEVLPDQDEDPELHEAIVSGLQFYIFNKMAELATGEDVAMDFGNLAPADAYGLYAFMRTVMTTEMGEMFANTPSGQLISANGRITKLAKTIGRFVTQSDTDSMSPTTLSNVFRDLAGLSSGMSNIFKAKMALEYHKAYGNRGQVTDQNVSTPEAIFMAFGFHTLSAAQSAWVGMDQYAQSSAYTKDVNEWYKQFAGKLASEGGRVETDDFIVTTMSMAHAAFGNDSKALGIIRKNLDRDSQAGKGVMYSSILRMADYTPIEKLTEWANTLPDDGSGRREALKETIELIREYKEEK